MTLALGIHHFPKVAQHILSNDPATNGQTKNKGTTGWILSIKFNQHEMIILKNIHRFIR